MYLCVVSILPLCTIVILDYRTVSTMCCFSSFYYIKEVHKRHALLYIVLITNHIHKETGRTTKIKMDSYDVHCRSIQLQLYDKVSFENLISAMLGL